MRTRPISIYFLHFGIHEGRSPFADGVGDERLFAAKPTPT
jgi:hypothetical protein